MKTFLKAMTTLALTAASTSFASDEQRAVHDEHCTACHIVVHDEAFYTRKDRKVNNTQVLRTWVNNCQLNFGLSWWDEDVDAMTEYLNKSFYKFDSAAK